MASFVVMEPPEDGQERTVLIRDGFHFFAFLVPFIWLLVHRLWIEAGLALAAALAIGALGSLTGFGAVAPVLSLLVGIYVGLEGAALRVAALQRRGWREWGIVEADNPRDAEIRYVTGLAAEGSEDAPVAADATQPQLPFGRPVNHQPRASGPALGMLGYPGR